MTFPRPWGAALGAAILLFFLALVALAPAPGTPRGTARALDATLLVQSADGTDFLGSAFLWEDGELAVTNAHILKGNATVRLSTRDGRAVLGQVTATDPARDIALLALPEPLGRGLRPDTLPAIGTPILAMGAPLEAGFTVTRGIVSAYRQVLPSVPVRFVQHDAAINPGSSGGPLVTEDGQLVAMNARIADGSRYYVGISYAIPAALIAAFVEGDLPPVPELGLALRPVTPAIATALSLDPPRGLLVDDVTPGGAADTAGLRAGDVLTRAGGTDLIASGDLALALDGRRSLGLQILRDGAPLTLDLSPKAPEPAPMPRAALARKIPEATLADLGVTLQGTEIAAIDEAGTAYAAGLALGDRIEAIGPAPFKADQPLSLPALLRIRRGDTTTHVLIDPTRRSLRPLGGGNVLDPDVTLF